MAALALALTSVGAHAAATQLPPGEQCFQAQTGINGMVGALGTITAGSGGTAGSYGNVALTGGSGSAATANFTVAGGVVTQVIVNNPGTQYVVGDVLSAAPGNIGGVVGFSIPVNGVSINSSLAGGQVYFYIPGTTIFKTTWFSSAATSGVQNTNPVKLDQNGCAVIYGTGSYQEVVQDSLGNTIYSQITTDTSANNNTFWAGNAGGTPNAITVVDPGFNATDGSVIQFIAIATNTGATTLNPSGFGNVPIVKDTTSGPVSLTGGEIQQNNTISVIYSAANNTFTILNPVIQSTSSVAAPLCGANGLSIVSDATSPNTIIDVAMATGVTVNPIGNILNRSNVAFNINFTTIGANGLDSGSFAASNIYYLYLIDNGATPAGLASLSATAPTLPTGYAYKCRIGAIPSDVSTHLYGFSQLGAQATLTSNLSGTPFEVAALTGTCFVTYTTETFSLFPPTASQMLILLTINSTSAVGSLPLAGVLGRNAIGYRQVGNATTAANQQISLQPVGTNQIGYCSNSALNSMHIVGWTDSINAQ